MSDPTWQARPAPKTVLVYLPLDLRNRLYAAKRQGVKINASAIFQKALAKQLDNLGVQ